MQFMLMIYAYPDQGPEPGTEEHNQMMASYFAFSQEVEQKGIMISGSALLGPEEARTVTISDGKTNIADGPAVDTRPFFGGYYILECADLSEAQEYAARIPTAAFGAVEVRPLMVFD